ncbi:right-handed parallel beta-helix repeat-containing protein [Catenovulum adriaticum]|uniref:Right-handed parallel beta-helix repeat-containing protein n=1 Tax=Catenovulum adriaticum TaxID=2984846 RepID=A0ABY7AQN0_9ALTE|nr:right-handed parallel beta-helix repeat-containing protein [Catenovulum sp. TS8]WAJ70981.1 right-handed parallel beta-helix repeat-containing protein [Catenovulum sp. TS8]
MFHLTRFLQNKFYFNWHPKLVITLVAFFHFSICAEPILNTCTKIVNNNFSAESDGQIFDLDSYKTINDAIDDYQTNDVICVANQSQPAFKIRDFSPESGKLTIQPLAVEKKVTISNQNYRGTGVFIENSRSIDLVGFTIEGGLYGVEVIDSSDIRLSDLHVLNVGQEALVVKPKHQGGTNFILENNLIEHTGKRNNQYGEGIYLGDGSLKTQHSVSDIKVRNNVIQNTTSEAIDIKINANNVRVENNVIRNVDLKFNGAITIGTEAAFLKGGDYFVLGNDIKAVTNRSGYRPQGIAVGHGNTQIFNNKIEIADAKAIAICLMTTFMDEQFNQVWVQSNLYTGEGRLLNPQCGNGGTGIFKPAQVSNWKNQVD